MFQLKSSPSQNTTPAGIARAWTQLQMAKLFLARCQFGTNSEGSRDDWVDSTRLDPPRLDPHRIDLSRPDRTRTASAAPTRPDWIRPDQTRLTPPRPDPNR
eukprot:223760_1